MKLIRHIALTTMLTIGAFSAITYTSCNKDKCKDVVCQNGGTCNSTDGSCSCSTGYEGTNCETASRAKFEKTWTASDVNVSDNTNLPTYTSAIVDGTTVTDVKISNFSASYFTNDVKATVSGNTITIPSQQPDNDNYYVSGTGTYANGKITWTYTITNPLSQQISYTGSWQ